MNKEPSYDLEDRLINIFVEESLEPEDEDILREKVVKRRFLDIDENCYWYAIGLKNVRESFDLYREQYLLESYRRVEG